MVEAHKFGNAAGFQEMECSGHFIQRNQTLLHLFSELIDHNLYNIENRDSADLFQSYG